MGKKAILHGLVVFAIGMIIWNKVLPKVAPSVKTALS